MTDAKTQVDEAARLWASCAEALRTQVNDATWLTWFDGVLALGLTEDTLHLGVPNPVVRERLDSRWTGLITECLRDISGNELRVHYDVVTPPTPLTTEVDLPREVRPDTYESRSSGRPDDAPSNRPREAVDAQLNPRYTFDAFVIGASNRFAHAAAQSVAENPAKSYNPLFIHGGAGLGKTHLLHAIGNYVREQFPSRHVRYVSTETFLNEFVDAIRTNSTTAFKRRYRECDVLLVDDIQFMETKEGLQEEFFHTFNSLYGAGKQIVISSDRPPKAIATLEDRLRSRFLSGLITDVQPPELETRLAILRKKAEGERTHVPDEVLEFIATHVKDNIRELEGALIRVSAFASLNRQQLNQELAETVLADLVASDKARQITPRSILEATAKMYGFTIDEICGPSRRRPLVTARQVSMYVFRDLTEMSYPMIAREFGGRDHTTVIHAVEKISSLMREKRDIYEQVTELIQTIKAGG